MEGRPRPASHRARSIRSGFRNERLSSRCFAAGRNVARMSFAGGTADKLGGLYERHWTVNCALRVLRGEGRD